MHTCTLKGRSMVNPGRRNAVTTPEVNGIFFRCTPEGRNGGRIVVLVRATLTVLPQILCDSSTSALPCCGFTLRAAVNLNFIH